MSFFKGKAKVWWLYTYFLKIQNWNKRKTRCMVMLCPLAFFGSVVDALLRILYQFLSRSKRCRDNFEIYYMYVISKSPKQKFILSLYVLLTMTISRLSSSQNGVLLHVRCDWFHDLSNTCVHCGFLHKTNKSKHEYNRIKSPLNSTWQKHRFTKHLPKTSK